MRIELAVLAALTATAAPAQVVERHLPPSALPQAEVTESSIPVEQDDRPIGPPLRTIVLLGRDDPVVGPAPDGIDASRLPPGERHGAVHALRSLLGRPLSRQLIGTVVATVTRNYRAAGHALVSVVPPEQELTAGMLQLRIVRFSVGRVNVTGAATRAGRVRTAVRLRPGDHPSSAALAQDLDWLNRYPFAHVDAVLAPGQAAGETDVTLAIRATRPWRGYAGVARSDAPASGDERYFAGIMVGDVPGQDDVLSVQLTSSALRGKPAYLSVGARLEQPVAPRHRLEVSFDLVRSRRRFAPFSSDARVIEGAAGLRFALPPLWSADGRIGIEARRQEAMLRFGGEPVFRSAYDVFQLYVGANGSIAWSGGRGWWDVSLHASPGGITRANRSDALFAGRRTAGTARYAYVAAVAGLEARITRQLVWKAEAAGQFSGGPLPGTEQAALGGSSLVRGYTLDDGAFDRSLVVRNELQLVDLMAVRGLDLVPYGFADAGVAGALGGEPSVRAASLGVGATTVLFRAAQMRLELASPLIGAGRTGGGDLTAWWRVSMGF